MADAQKINPNETLRTSYPKINQAIENSNQAKKDSEEALQTANEAKFKADSTKTELDQIVIEGDSSVEAAQARVDADGNPHTTLKERLDFEHNQLSSQLAQTEHYLFDARYFGAKGDGVHDDTSALQTWLDQPGKMRILRDGVYRITSTLYSNVADRLIKTDGAKILVDGIDVVGLTVTGNNNIISVEIDGINKANGGILIKGELCEVINSRVENFKGTNKGAFGIRAETNAGVRISNNFIRNINSDGNGTMGDDPGSSRAIVVTSTEYAKEMHVVTDNYIDTIVGEEGDAIQFLFYDGATFPFLNSKGIIANNIIKDCNRRAIKIQASDCIVSNNRHINTLPIGELPNASNLIDIIQSNDIKVINNILDAKKFIGVKVSGNDTNRVQNVSVKGNLIHANINKNAIFFEYIIDSEISNNTIYDGHPAISGTFGENLVIDDNVIYGGVNDDTGIGINIVGTNRNISIRNNIIPSGKRLYMIQNYAPDCIIENNHCRATKGNIRTYASAAGSIYKNNTNASGTTTVIGDFTDQYLFGSRNTGEGAVGIPDVMYTNDIPSITHPNRHHKKGEVALSTSPTAGGKIGWVCTSSGSPGTWKAFGVIDS